MRPAACLAALLLCLSTAHVRAATYENADLSIALPPGFVGPHVANFGGPEAKDLFLVAFTRRHVDGTNTMIEIMAWDLHLQVHAPTTADLQQLGDKYLGDFLKGIERQQADFRMQPLRHVSIDGVPFSTRRLSGILRGRRMTGAMYCGLTESKVLCLHTQDFTDLPGDGLDRAITAIEGLRVTHPPGLDGAGTAARR